MSAPGDITHWLHQLQTGDRDAARPLWERYFRRLVGLARARLRGVPRGPAGAADVALSAFDSFCRRAEQGRFPRLEDRDDLWKVLFTITTRKAARLARDSSRVTGGGGVPHLRGVAAEEALDRVEAREPTPAFAAEVAEACRRLLGLLGDEELRQIAVWKMEGYTNAEIAGFLNRAVATVERRIQMIRKTWEQEIGPAGPPADPGPDRENRPRPEGCPDDLAIDPTEAARGGGPGEAGDAGSEGSGGDHGDAER
jgi:DNA-directed RNA polymerase specialized sigma24 family protein